MPSGMAFIDFHGPQAQRSLRDQVARCGDGGLVPVPAFDPAADPVNLAGLADEQSWRACSLRSQARTTLSSRAQ